MNNSFLYEELDQLSYRIDIVDVGASSLGGYAASYESLMSLGRCKLTGFEPDPEAFDKLITGSKQNCEYHQRFIADGETRTFYETNWSLTGSLYPPNTDLLKRFHNLNELVTLVAEHPVQTYRLDDTPNLEKMDFLKMDVQGAELDVLKHAPRLLKTCLVAQLEVEFVELYKTQPLFADVDLYMRNHGFQFHKFDKNISGRTFNPLFVDGKPASKINQCLWSDAWYVRDWMGLSDLSREQLLVFSILALVVCESPDLALMILNNYDQNYRTSLSGGLMSELGIR
jgi:protein O-GlcNAc transferase